MPPLDTTRLCSVQAQAIAKLEALLARADPRALIQMATGSGKTFPAVNTAYRLLKFGQARRILFLVDRDKLSLDLFWIKDKSLTDTDALPEPEVLALEIADELEAALSQFSRIAARLTRDAGR